MATGSRLGINHRGALLGPFIIAHRSIGDNVFAQHVIDILNIAPVLRVPVLQLENSCSNIGRHMLDIVHDDGLFGAGRHEDLDGVVVIAISALVESATCVASFDHLVRDGVHTRR